MSNNAVQKVFRNDSSACTAVWLEEALERIVCIGLEIKEKYWSDKDLMIQALEIKAVPVIKGILQTIHPEMTGNIRDMDEGVIWRLYWELRNDGGAPISIFKLLTELNNNPPLAPVVA